MKKKYFRGYHATAYRSQTISWIFYYLLNGKCSKEVTTIEDTEKKRWLKKKF